MQNPFEKSVDQTRLDRLRGGILAAVSEFEDEGFTNMEIARALIWASYSRASRESIIVRESFWQFCKDNAAQTLEKFKTADRAFALEYVKQQIN